MRPTACLLLFVPALSAWAQSVTGQISGTVSDTAGQAIPGVAVRLTHDLSQQIRHYTSDGAGTFLFPNLIPGGYSLHIEHAGFKAYDQRAIQVSSEERVALHQIRLTVGDVSTSVEVQADVARVATDTSDRSILIDRQQIEDTPISGRDYIGILRTLPGTQMVATSDMPGWFSSQANPTNGGQTGQFAVTLDGVVSQDSGTQNTGGYLAPNIDAIGEVKVRMSNYTAEYGARAGGQMNVSIRAGTNKFHGSAYYFWRHEMLSANEFFNNKNVTFRNGVGIPIPKPYYRYQNPGGTIGGPLLIPGTRFNQSRTRLFFFFSEEYLHTLTTGGVNSYTMPTALERQGDFSQTVTTTGVRIPIKDPTTGTVLPDNILPASRINPIGYGILNLFPLPFTTDGTGRRQFNTQYQFNRERPREDRILRVDFGLGPHTASYLRLIQDFQADRGVGATLNGGGGWGQFSSNYDIQSAGAAYTVIHTFRPNLILESLFGINRGTQHTYPSDDAKFRATNDLSAIKGPDGRPVKLPNFFGANVLNLAPIVSFANNGAQSAGQGVTAPPTFGFDSRWPFYGTDQLTNVTSNLTWIKSKHTLKAGIYFEHNSRNASTYSTYNPAGSYWFGSDTANPNDTGYAFSNALAGTVQAYGEDNKKLFGHTRYNQVEWFVQDTARVTRRLTFDLGVRFQIIQPTFLKNGVLSMFQGDAYDPAKTGQLLFPALVNGQKVALNQVTGATYAFGRATSFDPASYPAGGLPYTGMREFQDHFFHTPRPLIAPRAGFAWDVFGRGRTALRGGFGIFYGRPFALTQVTALSSGVGPLAAPPGFRSPIYYNTTFDNLLATQGFYGAQNVIGGSPDYKNPSVYNWSFGLQQDLRHGIILDVSYIGNVAHNGFGQANDANAVPPYTTWTPEGGAVKRFLDPTSNNNGTAAFYGVNLIRSLTGYRGFGSVSTFTSLGESSYNALQVSLNKRFNRRYQFSANYTWSKTLTFSHQQWIPDNLTKTVINRPHAVNLNFGYDLPSPSRYWKNWLTKGAFDGWRFSGVGALFAGTPISVACAATNAPIGYWTGTPTGGIPFRCQMNENGLWRTDDGKAPGIIDQRLYYPFAASTFSLPGIRSLGFGNTPPALTYGPGMVNFDVALNKSFRVHERKTLELRAEAFNVLNHFNPANPNASLTFNFNNNQQTNAGFGQITGTQHVARRMAMSLRFRF